MNRSILIFVFSTLSVVLLGAFTPVFACSCRVEAPVCEEYGSAKAIFVGKVLDGNSVERFSDRLAIGTKDLSFVFDVQQNFLGAGEGNKITIHTGFGFGDCGFPFEKGESYLVYAFESEGHLKTSICSRTRHISKIGNGVEELKNLLFNNGARLYGTVTQYAKSSLEQGSIRPEDKLNLRVEQLDGAKKNFEVITDNEGKYSLGGLPTGKYKVVPLLQPGWMVDAYTQSEFLLNDKGCARRDFLVRNDSRISGKVIDKEGKPVNNIFIDLIPPNTGSKPKNLLERTVTTDGAFTFYHVPPGTYRVVANYTSQPDEENPFPTTFYKVSGERSIGTVIDVALGQEVNGIVINLPSRLPMKEMRGRVVWKDGKPVGEVLVNLRDFESRQNISGLNTDESGNFVVKGFVGRKYILETYLQLYVHGKFVTFEARDMEFVLKEKNRPVTLVLQKKAEEQ